ncbi:hypothetical protein TUBRATIS_009330 [Tubulinosema ratisbonensis]|uniref:Uncharacterized protein n=1 Tax=Tubulinosema ratisbonensis TaxID=291195 RepID=A0A437AMZ5_9MICR|nr:hypothetical protein TUBRATIS_009330 [Tubulinosema ratisbonensis]
MSFLFFSMIMTVKLTFNKSGSYLDELKSHVQKYPPITEVAPIEMSLTTKFEEFGGKKFFKHEKLRLTHLHHTFRLKLLNLISRFGIKNSLFINHEINKNLWVLLLQVTKNNFVLYSFQLHLFFNLLTSRQCKDEIFFRKMKHLCSKNVENIISVFAKEYVFDILEIEEITHKMDKNHIDDNDVLKALFAKFDRNIQKTKQSKLELIYEDFFRNYNRIIFNRNVSKGLVSTPTLQVRFLLMTFESIFASENYKFLNHFMPEINIFQKALTTNDLPLISLNCIHFVLTFCLVRFEYTVVLLFGKVENLYRKCLYLCTKPEFFII